MILDYVRKTIDKYNSPQIQNDIIEVMADSVYTTVPFKEKLMADQVSDSSNREQILPSLN